MNLAEEKILRQHLTFIYRVIVASETLLKDAVVSILFNDDEFSEALYSFYQKHLREEREHAEWLHEDLGVIPVEIDWTAACLAGTQYYLIKHVHPGILLGYMQALEVPAPISMIEELESIHGKKLLRTWRHHAEVDGDHSKEIERLIAMAPSDLRGQIEENRQATIVLLDSVTVRYRHAH